MRVYLSHAVVRDLRARLAQTTEQSPEFAGALLGRVGPRHEGTSTVLIDNFLPVTWPADDPGQIKSELDQQPQRAVGFFRSHARSGLELDKTDLVMFQACFPDPSCVFLLARQGDPEQTAGFFIREGDDIEPRGSQEFSLAEAVPAQSTAVIAAAPPPKIERLPARRRRKIAAIAAVFLIVPPVSFELGRSVAVRQSRRASTSVPATSTARPQLILQTRQAGNSLEVTWNPADPALGAADHARMFVSDGELRGQHWLDAAALASGKFVYQPVTDKVAFRLELYSMLHRQEAAATLDRVQKASPLVAKPSPPPTPRTTPPASRENTSAARKEAARSPSTVALPASTSDQPLAPLTAPLREPASQPARVERESVSAPPVHAAVSPPDRPQTASVARVTFSLESVPPSRIRQAIQKVPGLRALQRSQYRAGDRFVPARTLSTVLPSVPQNRSFDRAEQVNVMARVEKNGAITEVGYQADGDRTLGKLAADAVNQWRFAPALLNGTPVSSKVILHFKFSAAPQQSAR